MARPGIPKETIEKIISLRQQGHSQSEIQKITGVSRTSISRVCQPYVEKICERKKIPDWFPEFKIKWNRMRKSLGKT